MRIRSKEDAIAAYTVSRRGSIPEGCYVTARCFVDLSFMLEDGECLWAVGLGSDDEENWITPGTTTILGPDGKGFSFPNNPNFYDREIMETVLTLLYTEDVAGRVDPDAVVEQVKAITIQRRDAISALLDAAREGTLRRVSRER